MKKSIKRLLAAVLALSCAAPAAVISAGAEESGELINYYSFDGASPLESSVTKTNGGMLAGSQKICPGLGSNSTKSLNVYTTSADQKANFYQLSMLPDGKFLKVSDPENKYVRVDARIYVNDDDGFNSVSVGDNWGGALTEGITKDNLEVGKWNDISFISSFENIGVLGDGNTYFNIYTDLIVNGVRVKQNSPIQRYNSNYRKLLGEGKATDDDIERFYMTLLLQGDGKSPFAAYIDDVKTTTYTANNFSWAMLINSWNFEGSPFHINDQQSMWNASLGGTNAVLSSAEKIGSNTTKCAMITAPEKSTYPNLNTYRKDGDSAAYVPDLYDESTNPYLLIKFDIYADENLQKFYIGNVWGSAITEAIDASNLKANSWNSVAAVLKLTNKDLESAAGEARFTIISDIYVNGKLLSDQAAVINKNPEYKAENPDSADALGVRLAFEGENYTLYLDKISVMQKYGDMKSEAEFLLDMSKVAPKLISTDKTSVKDNVVSVITGTEAQELKTDIDGALISAMDEDGNPRDGALEEGDTVYATTADGVSAYSEYTVKLIEAKLVAPVYYVSNCINGVWGIYYSKYDYDTAKNSTLQEGLYAFPAEILNTTGKDADVMTILALYEKDGRLVELKTARKTVPTGLNNQQVRVDYEISASDLADGRYIKAIILQNPTFTPVLFGKVEY